MTKSIINLKSTFSDDASRPVARVLAKTVDIGDSFLIRRSRSLYENDKN